MVKELQNKSKINYVVVRKGKELNSPTLCNNNNNAKNGILFETRLHDYFL